MSSISSKIKKRENILILNVPEYIQKTYNSLNLISKRWLGDSWNFSALMNYSYKTMPTSEDSLYALEYLSHRRARRYKANNCFLPSGRPEKSSPIKEFLAYPLIPGIAWYMWKCRRRLWWKKAKMVSGKWWCLIAGHIEVEVIWHSHHIGSAVARPDHLGLRFFFCPHIFL